MTTTTDHLDTVDWNDLLDRWDQQQAVYVTQRETGFALILDILDQLAPGPIRVLDLAAGPGSISQRLLDRRHDAHAVALDLDPVLQAIGRRALGDRDGRLSWVTADLRDPAWTDQLHGATFDAVASSTATHWLRPAELAAMYQTLAGVLRPSGVVINFDGFPPRQPASAITAAVNAVYTARQERALTAGAEGWQDWWDAARAIPALSEAFAACDRIYPVAAGRSFGGVKGGSIAFHREALLAAGFAEAESVWQDLSKHILVAVR